MTASRVLLKLRAVPGKGRLDPHDIQEALDELMEADEPFELAFAPYPTTRGIADAAFVVVALALVDRYGNPDFPRSGGNLEPVDDAEGSPMAVWDLEEYELALYVKDEPAGAGLWLTRD